MIRFSVMAAAATLLAGCAETPDELDASLSPVFTSASIAPDGATLTLAQEENTIWAIAEDDQDEALDFHWTLDGETLTAEPVYMEEAHRQGSTLTLAPAPEYSGSELRCVVYDLDGNEATLSYWLEVP